ncbi:NAD-dependent protein deacetylase hst2-1 [Colletotrichum orbiculare MAFF 240422]|uniref:NAD-dependent protein deacetylase hst2-1 n=1 Tax=Colletotrichum orbiculare (strain 104-T / ATCC 96160 / CBS 514.97 / LARS 414 / MAFF 240422) TaxID=1213857 RepID=A0A484FTB6_COLOR|nr:NAD-dependent protein deacetylase hst2-1 [Colletotrichum orbiculare MAFF 240422]
MTNKHDVGSDADAERRPAEETPLLAHDLPANVAPSRAYQIKVIGLAMTFILLIEIGAYLQIPPTYQLMEEIICRKHYPDHVATDAADDVCKSPEVAGELAMIKGWHGSFDCIPPLITSIPYGIISDKYGRRPVLSLAMLGLTLEFLWMLQPLLWPNVLPLWTVWFGSIFQFIGGGAAIVQAMVWTMISDVVPISNITAVYYRVGAMVLVGEFIVAPTSAALLTKSPWLPLSIGMGLLIFGTCLPPFMPETYELRRLADVGLEERLYRSDEEPMDKRSMWGQIVHSMKNDMSHVYNFLIKSQRVIALILGFNLTVIVRYVKQEIMSQYVHNLFGWSWAKATLLGTVSSATNMAMLLVVLPALSWSIVKKTGMHPLIRDLWLTRMCGIFLSLGCFMVTVAYKPWFMIAALVIFSMGACYTNICRAVLNAVVEPHTIGTLNTAIAWVEQLSMLISAPVISALLRAGNTAGGHWIGLPYFAATIMSVAGTIVIAGGRRRREKHPNGRSNSHKPRKKMGNEESTMLDDSVHPKTLESRTLQAIADHIKSGNVKSIAVMTGAGISTAAGIPDFRSPGTGLYANLARLNLPYAEAVFDISYFRKHPEPFYYLAKELYPGKFFPTVSHAFIALLAKKDLLQMNFTQNIDCLERRAGVPDDKIIEAHGSFATQRCIECGTPFPDDRMKEHVQSEIVPTCDTCDGLVKPDIVFFGEALPEQFRHNTHLPSTADLIIVMGTSLSVYPFAGLAEASRSGIPRLLLNRERVGQMGRRADDVVELGTCDAGVRKLASLLGWRDDLEELWRGIVGEKEAERQLASAAAEGDFDLEEEIRKVTEGVDTALKLDDDKDDKDERNYEPEAIAVPLRQDGDSATENAQDSVPKAVVSRMVKAIQGQEAEVGIDIKEDRGREGHTINGSEGAPKEATDFRAEAKRKIQLAALGAATPLDEVAVIFDPNAPVAEMKGDASESHDDLVSGPARYDPSPVSASGPPDASAQETSTATTAAPSSVSTTDVPSTHGKGVSASQETDESKL